MACTSQVLNHVVAELSFENSPGMILVIRVDEGKAVDSIEVSSHKAFSQEFDKRDVV